MVLQLFLMSFHRRSKVLLSSISAAAAAAGLFLLTAGSISTTLFFHDGTQHLRRLSLDEFTDPKSMAAASNTSNTLKVSLVTSFWAEEVSSSSSSATTRNPHRKEMDAALLANLYNEHFDEVVVFLDGVNDESNCAHFVQHIVELQHAHAQIMHHDDDLISSKLTCVNVQ